MSTNLEEALGELVGVSVSSVAFVANYTQIVFQPPPPGAGLSPARQREGPRYPRLSLYVWPVLRKGLTTWRFGDEGYRDVLCSLIGLPVAGAHVNESEAVLRFSNGPSVSVSLRPSDRRGPEALMFWQVDGAMWVE